MKIRLCPLFLISLFAVLLLAGCGGSGTVPTTSSDDVVILDPEATLPPFNPAPPSNAPEVTTQALRPLRIYVLSVNQADATYIEAPDGRNVLIDGGQGDDVVKRMKALGVWGKRLDLVILTHPHIDHVGGLLYVINGCPISEIWETGVNDSDFNPWYSAWRDRVKRLGVPDRKVKAGKSVTYGGATIKLLAPQKLLDGQTVPVVNNASIVTSIAYGSCKALLMADAENPEQMGIQASLGHVQFLKVPHHGARNAALEDTYRRTTPDVAVITAAWASSLVGIPNSYTMSLIRKYCVRSYITWRDGTVIATMDGKVTTVVAKSN